MDILGTIRKWSAGLAETAISLAALAIALQVGVLGGMVGWVWTALQLNYTADSLFCIIFA